MPVRRMIVLESALLIPRSALRDFCRGVAAINWKRAKKLGYLERRLGYH